MPHPLRRRWKHRSHYRSRRPRPSSLPRMIPQAGRASRSWRRRPPPGLGPSLLARSARRPMRRRWRTGSGRSCSCNRPRRRPAPSSMPRRRPSCGSSGSTIKPFVYATGLDSGMTPASMILDGTFCVYQGGRLGPQTVHHRRGVGVRKAGDADLPGAEQSADHGAFTVLVAHLGLHCGEGPAPADVLARNGATRTVAAGDLQRVEGRLQKLAGGLPELIVRSRRPGAEQDAPFAHPVDEPPLRGFGQEQSVGDHEHRWDALGHRAARRPFRGRLSGVVL